MAEFPSSVRFKMQDFAYLGDFDFEGEFFQLSIGVVRREELPRRVFAMVVVNPPAVATFCNIVQTWKRIDEAGDCMAALGRTLNVGRLIMTELEQNP